MTHHTHIHICVCTCIRILCIAWLCGIEFHISSFFILKLKNLSKAIFPFCFFFHLCAFLICLFFFLRIHFPRTWPSCIPASGRARWGERMGWLRWGWAGQPGDRVGPPSPLHLSGLELWTNGFMCNRGCVFLNKYRKPSFPSCFALTELHFSRAAWVTSSGHGAGAAVPQPHSLLSLPMNQKILWSDRTGR